MNSRDSEKIAGMMYALGFEETSDERAADIIIFNTCCVRENAENKIFGHLGQLKALKAQKPRLRVALCGCMIQQDIIVEKIKSAYSFVDILFGTFNLHRLPQLLRDSLETEGMVIDIWKEPVPKERGNTPDGLPTRRRHAYKSGVNIMYGCNNFCSYCIVPYVRGRERSRHPEDILEEVRALAADGVREVMLLGQNVNSYSPAGAAGFPELLRRVNEVSGLRRVRFMTSHPKDLSPALIRAMAECEKVCRHLHLPLQSGSTEILRRMNRGYTKEGYLSLISALRGEIPNIALTTDIIVGFPGETEEDFRDTLEVVDRARFANAFTFLYSPRTGTPAAGLPGRVPDAVAGKRFNALLDTLNKIILEQNTRLVGAKLEVMTEEEKGGIFTGRTEDNRLVHFTAGKTASAAGPVPGEFVDVKITEGRAHYLIGRQSDDQTGSYDGAIF
jgi:tRNA-2-methylthio-N6-dimethylallyladenosine synthase